MPAVAGGGSPPWPAAPRAPRHGRAGLEAGASSFASLAVTFASLAVRAACGVQLPVASGRGLQLQIEPLLVATILAAVGSREP